MYFYELGEDIDAQVDNATIVHLVQLWRRQQQRAGGDLPRFEELSPDRLEWCRDDLMVLAPEGADDFRYVHYGANVAAASGFDMTGRLTGEFRSEVGQFFRDKYHQCLASGRPLYTVHRGSHAPTVHTWERLMLPVRAADAHRLVVFNRPLAMRHEFLQGVLETTGAGVISLAAVHDGSAAAVGFHVASANQAVADMLATEVRRLADRRLGEGFPEPFAARVELLAQAVYEGGAPASVEVHDMLNGMHRYLKVTAARSGDGVTLAVVDNTAYREQERALRDQSRRLREETAARLALERELQGGAGPDVVTELLPRQAFLDRLGVEVARASRHGRRLGLLVLELNPLRAVTETRGAAEGDRVLARAAEACRETLRRSDVVGRLDGARFAVCLPEADPEALGAVGQRVRTAVAGAFEGEAMLSLRITASVGAAAVAPEESARGALARAEAALVRARAGHGDGVVVAASGAGGGG